MQFHGPVISDTRTSYAQASQERPSRLDGHAQADAQRREGPAGMRMIKRQTQSKDGTKDRRPALDQLVADAKRRKFDVLVCWRLDRLGRNLRHKAINPRYKNRRAEMWLTGAEAIRNCGALPPLPDMIAELTEPTYTFLNGVFQLEEKDQIKMRLGRSPDLADAFMQTFAIPDMPADMMQQKQPAALRDFDPFVIRQHEAGVGRAESDGDPFK